MNLNMDNVPPVANYLFVGRFFPPKMYATVIDDSFNKIEFSNHNFEMSLIDGLVKQEGIFLKLTSVPAVSSFPLHNKKAYVYSENYIVNSSQVKTISFCTIAFIHKFSIFFHSLFGLVKLLRTYPSGKVNVILNCIRWEILLPLYFIKIFSFRDISQTIVVPDMPAILTNMHNDKGMKGYLLRILDKLSMTLANKADNYVLLTDEMKYFFKKKQIRYLVMEGLIRVDNISYSNPNFNNDHPEILLYTGSLKSIFGVKNLVDAFEIINSENLELWICGSGDFSEFLAEKSVKNNKIKFFGLVNAEKARELQQKATILVNPRTNDGVYTKYSFPSKTMEYLLSGKSVIFNRLSGIPSEYYKYGYIPKNESADELANTIRYVLSEDKNIRAFKAREAQRFIMENKNSVVQIKNILDFIN